MTLGIDNHNPKPQMLSGTKTGNRFPHDEKMYATLLMGMHRKRQRCLMLTITNIWDGHTMASLAYMSISLSPVLIIPLSFAVFFSFCLFPWLYISLFVFPKLNSNFNYHFNLSILSINFVLVRPPPTNHHRASRESFNVNLNFKHNF